MLLNYSRLGSVFSVAKEVLGQFDCFQFLIRLKKHVKLLSVENGAYLTELGP